MAARTLAVRRLLKDLQEVKECPLVNVVGEPEEGNLFVWHVNIRSSEDDEMVEAINPFTGAVFHLILQFPSSFPTDGPTVYLCTPLPHPNVALQQPSQAAASGAQVLWEVSLWHCTPAYKGWSSAYSVQSVLLQLQTFLLQEDLLYDVKKVPMHLAIERSRRFSCEGCAHTGTKPFPMFLTQDEIEVTLRNRQKKLISAPHRLLPSVAAEKAHHDQDNSNVVNNSDVDLLLLVEQEEREWQTVTSKKRKKSSAHPNVTSTAGECTKKADQLGANPMSHGVQGKYAQDASANLNPNPNPTKPRISSISGLLLRIQLEKTKEVTMEDAMGTFGLLPPEPLTTIMCMLSTQDLSSMSLTCKGLKAASEDGYLWKSLLRRHFPASNLSAASMQDWKHVFILEQSNIIESLHCFHTKCTHEEDILGFPISYTINPRTRDVDYIQVHLDVMSREAYGHGVRNTADNQTFNLLLPLYITPEHFERALPLIQAIIAKLCPYLRKSYSPTSPFHPDMVLEVMPKVLNTMVVLLCDKGLQASERAIEGYCMMHRLFLALCETYNLHEKAEQDVIRFKKSPRFQTKDECPDLGRMMARLSVCFSPATAWKEIVRPLTSEVFDRTVMWICKHDPSIVQNFKKAGYITDQKDQYVDEVLLQSAWEGSRVALRLNMFHVGFLHLLARPSGVSLKKVIAGYDALYGMPSLFMKKRIQDFIKKVINIGYDWGFFFTVMGMQSPSKQYLTSWLGQCWKNSLSKGYHTRTTRFENIQKRGVSKILLKGESYSAPVNMRTVKMVETWRWVGVGQKYLDASCLVYGFGGEFLEVVDYCHAVGVGGAVRHSGDVLDFNISQGMHTITINLADIPMTVKELYFTMSGWRTAKLSDFRLPFVQLKDEATGTELCEYTLEDKTLLNHISVIMCRMYRSPALLTRWEVQALGCHGMGCADSYWPIKNNIQRIIKGREPPKV